MTDLSPIKIRLDGIGAEPYLTGNRDDCIATRLPETQLIDRSYKQMMEELPPTT